MRDCDARRNERQVVCRCRKRGLRGREVGGFVEEEKDLRKGSGLPLKVQGLGGQQAEGEISNWRRRLREWG